MVIQATLVVYVLPGLFLKTVLIIRRAHDLGYTGWISVITYIPLVGIILEIILLFVPSHPNENKFGPPIEKRKFLEDIFNN